MVGSAPIGENRVKVGRGCRDVSLLPFDTVTDVSDLVRVTLSADGPRPLHMYVKPTTDRFFSAMVAEHGIWEPQL
jgi:hypothetical protein